MQLAILFSPSLSFLGDHRSRSKLALLLFCFSCFSDSDLLQFWCCEYFSCLVSGLQNATRDSFSFLCCKLALLLFCFSCLQELVSAVDIVAGWKQVSVVANRSKPCSWVCLWWLRLEASPETTCTQVRIPFTALRRNRSVWFLDAFSRCKRRGPRRSVNSSKAASLY